MEERFNMLPISYQEDIQKAIEILKKHGVKEIYIFGSIANGKFDKYSDIDIAVKGLNPRIYYKVAGVLFFELENNFDLIDLDDTQNDYSQMLLKQNSLIKIW